MGNVAGETRANVIPLHTNRSRVAARRRAGQRAESRQHPSLLSDPNDRASAEQIAAVVREIDEHRRAAGATTSSTEATPNDLAQLVAAVAGFLRQRLTGDYSVDEFGFDPHFNSAIVRPLLHSSSSHGFGSKSVVSRTSRAMVRRWWWPITQVCCRLTG